MAYGPDTRKVENLIRNAARGDGYLIIRDLKLDSLPEFPNNLRQIQIINTPITSLPKIPSTVYMLHISFCKNITSLPELPDKLFDLSIRNTPITTLPSKLPDSLKYLDITATAISVLPELPANLRELNVSHTTISVLPELPAKLERLHIHNTKITILPELPTNLLYLITDNTPLILQMNPEEKIQDYNLRWRKWKIENAELNKQKRYNVGKALEQRGIPGTSASGPLKNILGFAGIPAPAKGTGRRKRKTRKTKRNLKRK